MFPNRRLSLPLMMLVGSSTALASAYEIDRPDSTLQVSSPYSPLLFAAFISNLAGRLRLGNDPLTARSSELVFDLASLASSSGAFQTDTTPTFPDTSRRLPPSVNCRATQKNARSVAEDFGIRNSDSPQPALVVDEFPCLGIPSPH